MNAFASYGETRASRQKKADKPLSELDKKMAEKQRMTRAYRGWKRQWRAEALALEPRLRSFLKYLRTITPQTSDELIDAISGSWLVQSTQHVRLFALELISRHCDRVNRRMGHDPLDDPLWPETSLYFECRDLLYAGGRA